MTVSVSDVREGLPPQSEVWLERITEHVLSNGLADASLRKLAAVAGTSHRMLSYYFGSRDGVLGAVLRELRRRQGEDLVAQAATRREALERAWASTFTESDELQGKIFFYLAGLAVNDAASQERFIEAIVSTWTEVFTMLGVREGLARERAAVEARLLVASVRGLVLDWMLTKERHAVDAAFASLLDAVLGPSD